VWLNPKSGDMCWLSVVINATDVLIINLINELLCWTIEEWLMTHKGNWASGIGELNIWLMPEQVAAKIPDAGGILPKF